MLTTLSANDGLSHHESRFDVSGDLTSVSTAKRTPSHATGHGDETFEIESGDPNTHVEKAYRRLSVRSVRPER